MTSVSEAKTLICEMCRNFYAKGWASGTGGGMSIKVGDQIVMAPSGVQKERMREEDMFVLDAAGGVLHTPEARPAPYKPPKLSECSPLFMAAYELRGAGAVLHSHSINAVMATLLQQHKGKGCAGEFKVTNLEMIKGITGHGYFDECVVPIIDNTARECELTSSLREAMQAYPKATAVLVKRHGVYVWGDTWIQAKTQAECYEYLFEAAVKLHSLGIDVSKPPSALETAANGVANGHATAEQMQPAAKKARLSTGRATAAPTAIVLDIEGTVTPISFVTETLFPYAKAHLEGHLMSTWDSDSIRANIALLVAEAAAATDEAGVSRPHELATVDLADRRRAIQAAVRFVETLMAEDRKSTGLKALQGRIWKRGFENGDLRSELFPDVVPALLQWHQQGIKTYIYSSGSREAQRLLFAHTADGDLRPHLSGFFDTLIGSKVESQSYREIALSLGTNSPSEILFATDNIKEAEAATTAGWQVAITNRPGNAALPTDAQSRFRVITSMSDLLEQ